MRDSDVRVKSTQCLAQNFANPGIETYLALFDQSGNADGCEPLGPTRDCESGTYLIFDMVSVLPIAESFEKRRIAQMKRHNPGKSGAIRAFYDLFVDIIHSIISTLGGGEGAILHFYSLSRLESSRNSKSSNCLPLAAALFFTDSSFCFHALWDGCDYRLQIPDVLRSKASDLLSEYFAAFSAIIEEAAREVVRKHGEPNILWALDLSTGDLLPPLSRDSFRIPLKIELSAPTEKRLNTLPKPVREMILRTALREAFDHHFMDALSARLAAHTDRALARRRRALEEEYHRDNPLFAQALVDVDYSI